MNKTLRSLTVAALAALVCTMTALSAKAQITIMPIGDSGTVGEDYGTLSAGGWRDPLYHDLVGSGISFTFLGVNNANATAALTNAGEAYHNGYGGYTIEDIDANISGVAAPLYGGDSNLGGYWLTSGSAGGAVVTPTLILLQIGANDFIKTSQSMAIIEARLQKLVTDIHALTPNTLILLIGTGPFIGSYAGFNSQAETYNSYIQNTLVPSLSYTQYVENYTSYDVDGVVNTQLFGSDQAHMNRYGYNIMGGNWAVAVRAALGSNPPLYNLTVNNGTVNNVATSGSYPAGTVVTVCSNTPSAGNQFEYWTPSTQAVDNPYWQVANYTVPAVSSTVTANYAVAGSPSIPNGTYQITTGSYQFAWYDGLSMGAASGVSGALAQTQTYTGASAQQWVLTNLPSVNGTTNVVELSLPGSNLALGVAGGSTVSGANIDVETYTGALSQQWTLVQALGTTEIVNLNSGMAVDVNGYVVANDWDLLQTAAGYVCNQVWAFFPVTSGGYAPPAPTGLTATAGNAQVGLSWVASSGATSYNVYRGTSAGGESSTAIATGVTAITYTDSGLTNGTTYYYKVAAINSSGTSGYSNEASATPSGPGPSQITWGAAMSMTGDSDISTVGAYVDAINFGTAETINGVTFNPLGSSGGTESDPSGDISLSAAQVLTGGGGVGTFTGAYAAALCANFDYTAGTTTVSLANLTSGHVYQVQVWAFAVQSNPAAPNAATTLTGTNVVSLTSLNAGQYVIGTFTATGPTEIFTFDADEFQSGISFGIINGVSLRDITGAPAAPAGLTATAMSNVVSLSWTASSGAASYNVYRGTCAGNESPAAIATGVTSTAYVDTGLTNGTTYYYEVEATNSSGISGYSNEASATPTPLVAYSQWVNKYFPSDPANGGETATPQNDGVANLLKYLFDINPAIPMSASGWAALPVVGTTTISGSSYLTLIYRQNPSETGLTVNVQTSQDLQTWQTVTPNQTLNAGTDAATGDPLIEVEVAVNPANATKEFIRLNVTGP